MVKQNIIIQGYEDSEDGSRTRFKTNAGWMSAFKNEGETLITDLKSHPETLICCEVVQSKQLAKNGKPYLNIREFFGVVEEGSIEAPVIATGNVPIETKPMTEQSFESQKVEHQVEVKKPRMGPYEKDPVGLSVDIFIGLISDVEFKPDLKASKDGLEIIMNTSIELVKQAEKAF